MSDMCLKSLLHSVGVKTAVWLFCSYVLGWSGFTHSSPLIESTENKRRILIRCEFSIMSEIWQTLIQTNLLSLNETQLEETLLIHSNLLDCFFFYFLFKSSINYQNKNNDGLKCLLQETAAESERASLFQHIFTILVSTDCDAVLGRPHCDFCAKLNTKCLPVNYISKKIRCTDLLLDQNRLVTKKSMTICWIVVSFHFSFWVQVQRKHRTHKSLSDIYPLAECSN